MSDSSQSTGETLLNHIQRLQFTDRSEAEALLLSFVRETFPSLPIIGLELRPQAVSLNSFNGFLNLADNTRLFFKTHVELDGVIGEYYNAEMLAHAGYPIIQPLYSSTRSGQQLLIYPVVEDSSVFDIARQIERGQTIEASHERLEQAQTAADLALFKIYEATFASQDAETNAVAPIYQLFYHRLTGGRLERFYGEGTAVTVPGELNPISMAEVRSVPAWTINGLYYGESLSTIISRCIALLNPATAVPSIVGHGDAHNGNVFFNPERGLTYFDPAFAGRHDPLLDVTKPLFHNVFAMWMYFPEQEKETLGIHLKRDDDQWIIDHNYRLNPLRQMFLHSKVEHVLIPTLKMLRDKKTLRTDWRAYLKAALFCCPFLTLDLKRFPPEITLLGLTMAIQMGVEGGSTNGTRSEIDAVFDEAESAL